MVIFMQICNNFFVNHEQNNLELFLNHKFRVRETRVDSLPGGGMEFLWGMNIPRNIFSKIS